MGYFSGDSRGRQDIFMCLAALLCDVIFADSRMEPGAKISIKSFFMEIIFSSVHSAAVFLSFRQKYFHSE